MIPLFFEKTRMSKMSERYHIPKTPPEIPEEVRALKSQVSELESAIKKLIQLSNKQSAIINELTTRKLPTMRSEILELKTALSRMRTSGRD